MGQPSRPFVFQEGLGRAQSLTYLTVAVLLVTAAAFTLVGTVARRDRGQLAVHHHAPRGARSSHWA